LKICTTSATKERLLIYSDFTFDGIIVTAVSSDSAHLKIGSKHRPYWPQSPSRPVVGETVRGYIRQIFVA